MKRFSFFLLFTLAIGQLAAQSTYFFNIIEPFPISGYWENTEFGVPIDWGWDGIVTNEITGELVYAEPDTAGLRIFCEPNTVNYAGKIVFIDRGACQFSEKALFAQQQGAIGVVIVNIDDGIVAMAAGEFGADVVIPVIMLPASIADPIGATLLTGASVLASFSPTPFLGNILKGKLAIDADNDCAYDNGEELLKQFKVDIERNGTIKSVFSSVNGEYFTGLAVGDYMVSMDPPTNLWNACPPVPVTITQDTMAELDIVASPSILCPLLTIDISTPRLRRCFDNNRYLINYCNQGTIAQDDTYIQVELPPEIILLGASIAYTDLGNNMFEFQVGTLGVNECGLIILDIEVSCDNTSIGQTLCANAEIFPLIECGAPLLWTGVDIRANAECSTDAIVLSLTNQGAENMPEELEYRLIQDGEIIQFNTFQLNAGESLTLEQPANGSTYRIETDAIEQSYYTVRPSASIEGCAPDGILFVEGIINQYATADYGNFYDEDCTVIIGSYDPNDKQANIEGYGPKHYIDQNIGLEYKIRFQNTGTDTAFTVVVVDTLSQWLDPQTIRPLASSHNYNFSIENNIITAEFPNILLPDSTTNEPGSNGFITFRIEQMLDVPLESEINNRAGIYFDFNPPIITNTVMHTVGKDFIEVVVIDAVNNLIDPNSLSVFPNPALDYFTIQLKSDQLLNSQFTLYNNVGEKTAETMLNDHQQLIRTDQLGAGIYFYEVRQDGVLLSTGKIVKGK